MIRSGRVPTLRRRCHGRRRARAVGLDGFLCVAACLATIGCASLSPTHQQTDPFEVDAAWLLRQGLGQLQLLTVARPVAPVLHDPQVSADLKRRLALVAAARNFARDRLSLQVGAQYQSVVFLDQPAVVYVVTAAPLDALEPVVWHYPLVGPLPYRGWFSLAEAEHTADLLAAQGYEVAVRPVTTYSLLGLLPDPIVSSMLYRSDELDIVETVLHELAHATVFASGQGAFNEGLATFIGRHGRRLFVREHFGHASAVVKRSEAIDDDDDVWMRSVAALAFDLRVLFAQRETLPTPLLLEQKERIFARHQRHWQTEVAPTVFQTRLRNATLPDNNAALAAVGLYTLRQRSFEEAFVACGGDWRTFIALLRDVADEEDPAGALVRRMPQRMPEMFVP